MIALPGLGFVRAMALTQASTALTLVFPGGAAVGIAGSYGITRRWGFPARDVARAVTLVSLWNQLVNLAFPIVAVFLLTIEGDELSAALATAAFIGVAVLGVVVTGLVLVLLSNRLARDLGDVAARFVTWALAKMRRGPVKWGGESFKRFRDDVGDFLERKWPWLTLASLAGNLTVFGVLLVSLRALDVPASQVTVIEAFARLVVHPAHRLDSDHAGRHRDHRARPDGDARRLRRLQRERRRRRARLPLPHDRADAHARPDLRVHARAEGAARFVLRNNPSSRRLERRVDGLAGAEAEPRERLGGDLRAHRPDGEADAVAELRDAADRRVDHVERGVVRRLGRERDVPRIDGERDASVRGIGGRDRASRRRAGRASSRRRTR